MATKLVENLNENVWRSFSGYCKIKNVRVGDKLSEVLEEYLKNEKIL